MEVLGKSNLPKITRRFGGKLNILLEIINSYIMRNDIFQQRENWDKLSKLDPYWSILVSPDKIDNKWDLNEFYATGKIQVTKLLIYLKDLGFAIHVNNALDYGCGAGRLSETLSEYFDHVTGVDFSQNMINIAKAHNQFKNLNYENVNGKDLSNIQAKTFDFIVSLITLQHSLPKIQYNLLKEMVRVLKDDGVIVVSMVTHMGLSNSLRNAINYVNPNITNYFLQLWQRIKGRKLGHYDENAASQMFPISKRKVEVTLRNLGMDLKYINTAEISYKGDSKLELFIISSASKSPTHS